MRSLLSYCRRIVPTVAVSLLCCGVAYAQQLPWETPLQKFQESLTGPVARALGIVAMAVAGGMLAFGGELNDFTKRILLVVLAISVMLLASNFVSIIG
jgi:type IV secretory pathway VirB2 component (pilin)